MNGIIPNHLRLDGGRVKRNENNATLRKSIMIVIYENGHNIHREYNITRCYDSFIMKIKLSSEICSSKMNISTQDNYNQLGVRILKYIFAYVSIYACVCVWLCICIHIYIHSIRIYIWRTSKFTRNREKERKLDARISIICILVNEIPCR